MLLADTAGAFGLGYLPSQIAHDSDAFPPKLRMTPSRILLLFRSLSPSPHVTSDAQVPLYCRSCHKNDYRNCSRLLIAGMKRWKELPYFLR